MSPPESNDSSTKIWNKEVRRSLSEDDKRKFERKDGGSNQGSSASKKRKHESPHFERSSFGVHKKSGSPGSPNSKRPLFAAGTGSDKPKSKPGPNIIGKSVSSSVGPSKIKFSTGMDGLSTTSGIFDLRLALEHFNKPASVSVHAKPGNLGNPDSGLRCSIVFSAKLLQ